MLRKKGQESDFFFFPAPGGSYPVKYLQVRKWHKGSPLIAGEEGRSRQAASSVSQLRRLVCSDLASGE